jgi:uncharacterized coiled-coil DUF342 family protein
VNEVIKRTRLHPVNLDVIEDQISQLAGVPTLTRHEEDIGKLSADAVLEQYKMAAKSVEDMGEEIQKRIRALEAAIRECDADMKLLKEAADAIREKGKHAHAEIERTSAVSKDIRDIVASIKGKLA